MAQKKQLLTVFSMVLLVMSFLSGCANAADDDPLSLPPSGTVMILEAGNSTNAYFNLTLSDVPEGYDVGNGTYLGWCIDRTAEMTRLTPHTVNLYSSFNPEGELADENWTMVNYILNHKQGEAQDVQEAIWYFISLNGTFMPDSNVALAIINEAEANGIDFVPDESQVAAVIAFPVYITDPTPVQISILEVPMSSSNSDSNNSGNGSDNSAGLDTDALTAFAIIAVVVVVAIVVILLIIRQFRK
jgi:hypothetical protein